MSLWFDCGNGFTRSKHFARKELGADVYLCCPGPSLSKVDPESLNVPGAFTIAINTAYPYLKPDLWIGMDTPNCYDKNLWWETFPKICRSNYKEEQIGGQKLKHCPQLYFADVQNMADPKLMFTKRNHDASFVWMSNTFELALHVAVWMGAKKIHLLGCDFGGSRDYHDDRVLRDSHRKRNANLYRILLNRLDTLGSEAETHGIEIISCTDGSPANEKVKYMPLDDALKASQSLVPGFLGDDVLYATDSEQLRWGATGSVQNGVVTGADAEQEWLLPWWYENFRRHNMDTDIAFADFGMSPIAKHWCSQRGVVFHVNCGAGQTWHKKPFALMASSFNRSVWIDADCEVRKDVYALFDYAEQGLGLTKDPITRFCPQPGAWATGVIACSHGEPAIEEWCKEILLRESRGDQEALNAIRDRLSERLIEMPHEYQWLRLEGDSDQAAVMHWTGPDGKRVIARQKVA